MLGRTDIHLGCLHSTVFSVTDIFDFSTVNLYIFIGCRADGFSRLLMYLLNCIVLWLHSEQQDRLTFGLSLLFKCGQSLLH